MTRFLLWDVPDSTLLLETTSASEIRQSIETFIEDNGDGILAELLLGIEESTAETAQSFVGNDIVSELNRRASDQPGSRLKRSA